MLSESKKGHAVGTLHTKSKYFGQFHSIHTYFRPSQYDEKNEKFDEILGQTHLTMRVGFND